MRKRHPTDCVLSSSPNFRTWEGESNNGIALLTLGWAYILTASLAERQGLRMEYAPFRTQHPGMTKLGLEYASPTERSWWTAIVGRGVGWSICGGQVAPWAVSLDDIGVEIDGDVDGGKHAPTSREAACYLARFCRAYGLGNQSSAALAAALSLPLHASTTYLRPATIELPRPSLPDCAGSPSPDECPSDFQFIGYLMTLSLCPWAFGSSLWSIFWEPDVPCNFAGAWLGPIATILERIIDDNNLELLAKVLSFANVAPLWLGVALCGKRTIIKSILPSLAELRDYPYARPNVDAAAWTNTTQSFMDNRRMGPYLHDGKISRSDVWRLRHDCHAEYSDDGFLYTPPYGWPPFGEMRVQDLELELLHHLRCSHAWSYSHWTWAQSQITDGGIPNACLPLEQGWTVDENVQPNDHESLNNHDVSMTATKAVFWWCCGQVERGFGHVIVPRRYGIDQALESAESVGRVKSDIVLDWLESIHV